MKKFSYKYSIYQFLILAVGLAFIAFTIWSGFADENGYIPEQANTYVGIGYLVSLVVAFVYCYLYYQTSGYEFNEKEVVCKRGVVFKKKSMVEYSKIHAVNIKQTLIQRILGISSLMIDSGSTNTAHTAEIAIHDDELVIKQLYEKLQNKEQVESEEKEVSENLYEFTSSRKFLYIILNSFVALMFLIFGTIFVSIVLYLLEPMVEDQKITLIECILYPLGIFGFIFVCVALSNLVKVFISYYNFEIKKNNDVIEINYGLFSKIHNSFAVNRVRAVKISQGLIQRMFGFVTMRLEVVGYSELSNGDQVVGIFIPLCKKSEINYYLGKILPNYVPEVRNESCKSFKALVLWGLFFASIVTVLVIIPFLSYSVFANDYIVVLISAGIMLFSLVIFIIFYLIDAGFRFYNQGINIKEDKLTIYNGGLIKNITVILKRDLIAIEDITTDCRKKKGIYSYKIHLHTNAASNVVYVKALDEALSKALTSLLKY